MKPKPNKIFKELVIYLTRHLWIIDYIKNQKVHHQTETFLDEYKRLLVENGIEFDEKYLL